MNASKSCDGPNQGSIRGGIDLYRGNINVAVRDPKNRSTFGDHPFRMHYAYACTPAVKNSRDRPYDRVFGRIACPCGGPCPVAFISFSDAKLNDWR